MKKLFNLVTALVILHAGLYLSGCNSYKKELGKFQAFAVQHPNELARLCASFFPNIDSVSHGTETLSADSTESVSPGEWQVLQLAGTDTVIKIKHDTLRKTVFIKKTIRDTIYRTKTAQVDSLANYARAKEIQLAKAQQKQETTEKDRDSFKALARQRLVILIGAAVALLAFGGYKLYRFLRPPVPTKI